MAAALEQERLIKVTQEVLQQVVEAMLAVAAEVRML
jgi:hypothetical protein